MSKDLEITDPNNRYIRKDVIGTGAFKVVYRGFDTEDGREVAWNEISITKLSENSAKKLNDEVTILSEISHAHIIEFLDCWLDEAANRFVFVTEIMTSGNLREYITKNSHLKVRIMKKWSRQILEGLLYLHSHDPPIIHRDIKCDNIFIDGSSSTVKIGDLGLSTTRLTQEQTLSVIGTPEFMAPELYEEVYDEKVDVYAFGMCVLEMCTLEYPYMECENAAQIYRKVIAGQKPRALKRVKLKELGDFIEECLCPAPQRPTVKQLLDHEFLLSNDEIDKLSIRDITIDLTEFENEMETQPNWASVGNRTGAANELDLKSPQKSPAGPSSPAIKENAAVEEATPAPGDSKIADSGERQPKAGEKGEVAKTESDASTDVDDSTKSAVQTPELPAGENKTKPRLAVKSHVASRTPNISDLSKKYGNNVTPVIYVKDINDLKRGSSVDLVLTIPSTVGEDIMVEFEYDMKVDTPIKVASEMIQDVELPKEHLRYIADSIEAALKNKMIKKRKLSKGDAIPSIPLLPATPSTKTSTNSSPSDEKTEQKTRKQLTNGSSVSSKETSPTKKIEAKKSDAEGEAALEATEKEKEKVVESGKNKATRKVSGSDSNKDPLLKDVKEREKESEPSSPRSGVNVQNKSTAGAAEGTSAAVASGDFKLPEQLVIQVGSSSSKSGTASGSRSPRPAHTNGTSTAASGAAGVSGSKKKDSKLQTIREAARMPPTPQSGASSAGAEIPMKDVILARASNIPNLDRDDWDKIQLLLKKQEDELRKMKEKQAVEGDRVLKQIELKRKMKEKQAVERDRMLKQIELKKRISESQGTSPVSDGPSSGKDTPNGKSAGSSMKLQDNLDEKFLAQFDSDFGIH